LRINTLQAQSKISTLTSDLLIPGKANSPDHCKPISMSKPNALRIGAKDHLSVIHKASVLTDKYPTYLQDAVLQTNLAFNIIGWNAAAEELHGQPIIPGKNLFQLIDFEFINGSPACLLDDLAINGSWTGEVLFRRYDGQQIFFRTTATYIIDEKAKPVAVMIVCHNINDAKSKETELASAQKKYEILMNTLPDGVLMLDAGGKITACNRKGAEILGLLEDELLGKTFTGSSWKAVKPDGTPFPLPEFPVMVSLQTGFPQRNVKMGIEQPSGRRVWLSVNSQALIRPGEFEPYAAVVSYSDITDSINIEKELKKSNDRFYYVSKITSDAIWDIDLETNQIYRSEAFCRLSGYTPDEINAGLDWWFTKVHPDDRARVKNKVNEYLSKGAERWDDEYWFECADGSYKFLLDSGLILYRHGKPLRILGAIRDLTEKKKLEKQLLDEQAQGHKAIAQASIAAQEEEKSKISKELHDNVNQILMSAKLYMDTAKRTPEDADELLDKAIEYQLLALYEIRKLSKAISTVHVKTTGLKESVSDIVYNMKKLKNLDVAFRYDNEIDESLSDEEKLMLFRVIQEQTSNIIKYAEARSVEIDVHKKNGHIALLIKDDGIGFDPATRKAKGIGFINITSRADAYNGKVNIISSPGNGCSLELIFPFSSAAKN
jgi:PAS domain S-box-containing protein